MNTCDVSNAKYVEISSDRKSCTTGNHGVVPGHNRTPCLPISEVSRFPHRAPASSNCRYGDCRINPSMVSATSSHTLIGRGVPRVPSSGGKKSPEGPPGDLALWRYAGPYTACSNILSDLITYIYNSDSVATSLSWIAPTLRENRGGVGHEGCAWQWHTSSSSTQHWRLSGPKCVSYRRTMQREEKTKPRESDMNISRQAPVMADLTA